MKLIVGLGNPGRGYADSLHNLGFMCVNHFARTHRILFTVKEKKARVGLGEVNSTKVVVARPNTYMNLSGQAVSPLLKKHNISVTDLLVIHDDLDLPLGTIRLRPDGSSAGHKGVESIISEVGSQDFARLRVGIGRPISLADSARISDADIITFLLSDLPEDVKQALSQVIPRVSEAIHCYLTDGLTAAMNKYN